MIKQNIHDKVDRTLEQQAQREQNQREADVSRAKRLEAIRRCLAALSEDKTLRLQWHEDEPRSIERLWLSEYGIEHKGCGSSLSKGWAAFEQMMKRAEQVVIEEPC